MKNVEDIYPCSPLQRGLLFHALSAPGSGIYVNQCSCELEGGLDAAAFLRTWQLVTERHSVLRTAFVWEEVPEPLQVVRRTVRLPWHEEDWRGLAPAEQAERLDRHLEEERRRGFKLAQAPLMRVSLLRLDERRHRFVWTFHHLLLDGWSTSLLLAEVLGVYDALARGSAFERPAPPPFRQYIAWLQQQDEAAAEAFWRAEMAGFTAPTRLGIEEAAAGRRPAQRQERLRLPAPATAVLQALARRHRLTLSTVVQGAWALLLARYSGAADVVYGAVVSGRPAELPQVETIVGLFINTLPVRVATPAAAGALPWLDRLQARLLEMRRFEFTPLAQIRRWSEIPSEGFLFESLFAFENYPGGEEGRGGEAALAVRDLRQAETTDEPLTVSAEAADELTVRISYDLARFPPAAIVRLLGHLECLLTELADDAERPLHALSLLPASERQMLLCEWNDTAVEAGGTVTAVFAAAARRTPGAVALTGGSTALTYADLDARTNRLAHHLRQLGMGPEVRVGVYLERSLDLVITLLAVLKAGGAYVPLPPGYPEQRTTFMLADSAAALVVTEARLAPALPTAVPRLLLDAEEAAIAAQPATPVAGAVDPDSLAYVMYTSGSTGWPKGVAVPHRGIVRLVRRTSFAELDSQRVFLLLAPAAFDASTLEIWGSLLNGGRLAVPPAGNLSPQALGEEIAHTGANTLWLTAELFHLVIDEQPAALRGVTQLLAGGDVLSPSHVRRALAELPGITLINGYGPTENTTFTCCHRLRDAAEIGGPVAIGRPIAHSRAHVLDGGMAPVPVGVQGELYAGGAGLARGYLGRPDLTAERFVPDPTAGLRGEPGARLYRTGDRARHRPDGALDFLGRADRQVKLHGIRIELGEVEAALERHPAVRRAAAVLREDGAGRRLVAYAALYRDARADADEIRAALRSALPSALVPAAVVILDELPLTPSGKLDRRALPAPEPAGTDRPAGQDSAPRTAVEEQLAAIWAEVLGAEQVGLHDDFFALGGDSILAIQITARAARLGLRLTPQQVFEHPTVAELAGATSPASGGAPAPVSGMVFLTPIQRWFFERELPRPDHFNQAVLLELGAGFPKRHLPLVMGTLFGQHEALRLRFLRTAAGWEQCYADTAGEPPLSRLDLSALVPAAGRRAAAAAMADLQGSLDLARGPLAQVALLELSGALGDRLLWIVHHLAVDGVSWRVLLDDLRGLCEDLRAGRPPALPPRTASLQQWAERLDQHRRSEVVRSELEHWLAPARRAVAPLPLDAPMDRRSALRAPARALEVTLAAAETQALLQEVPAAFRTRVNDALLAALALALRRWTGGDRWLVDLEGHGREGLFADLDLSRTVGWFTTLYPVLLDLEGVDGAAEAALAVRQQLQAVPRRGIGYGLLRWGGDGETAQALALLPAAEVGFNYLGQLDASVSGDAPFRLAAEGTGPLTAAPARTHLLEIAAAVTGGCLRIELTYGQGVHERATVEALAEDYLDALRSLVEQSRRPVAAGAAPADFPSARLDADEFSALAGFLDGSHPA